MRGKPAEPAVCPDCLAVFHGGRWQWLERPAGAEEIVCPACHRSRDRFPAGFVDLDGPFCAAHREEILGLIRHHAEQARAAHPLKRLMAIEDSGGDSPGLRLTTTDIHLARELGEALHSAYQGELEFHYNDAENLLRVHWQR